ncbi:MAG: serine/threonine protein kinase [Deltaproteobacteria bacterium]|nr:serine/threonine protein kinase [Deltaproteobacteria bacterium]
MGTVMLATDPTLGRRVAIKVMHTGGSGSGASNRRLLREAQGMAQLSHENVIVVHEVGTHDGQVYLAMEYVLGGTLTRWQAKRPWREILATYLLAGRGLAAAHAAGLVHRDFKPDNVLVGSDGRVRVTDFGLVASSGESTAAKPNDARLELDSKLTATGAVLGTPRYMAPEQHDGRSVDARADQFAYCVALYAALYERFPFGGTTYDELADNVRAGRMRDPVATEVPAVIHAAIVRGLAVNPDDRFDSMTALLEALQPASPTATAPAPKRRWLWPVLGSLAVVGIAATIYVATRSDSPPAPAISPAPVPSPAPAMLPPKGAVAEAAAKSLMTMQRSFASRQTAVCRVHDEGPRDLRRAGQSGVSLRRGHVLAPRGAWR